MIAIQTLAHTGGLLNRSRVFNLNETLSSEDLPGGGGKGFGQNLSEMSRGRLPFLESLRLVQGNSAWDKIKCVVLVLNNFQPLPRPKKKNKTKQKRMEVDRC